MKWSKEEKEILCKNYPVMGYRVCSLLPHRSKKAIQRAAMKLGVTKYKLNSWTTEEKGKLQNIYMEDPGNAYKEFPGRTRQSVKTMAKRMGLRTKYVYNWTDIKRRQLSRLWPQATEQELKEVFPGVSMHALQEMARKMRVKRLVEYRLGDLLPLLSETNEAYYWIGYLMADGWISKQGQVVLCMAEKDRSQLQKYADFIKSNVRVIPKNQLRVAVSDKLLGPEIKQRYAFKDNKTENPPDLAFLKEDKFYSFLIGFIDGDGCILKHSKNGYTLKIECHKNWLQPLTYIADRIYNEMNVEKNKDYAKLVTRKKGGYTKKESIYVTLIISRGLIIKALKQKAVQLELPFLERKWGKVII